MMKKKLKQCRIFSKAQRPGLIALVGGIFVFCFSGFYFFEEAYAQFSQGGSHSGDNPFAVQNQRPVGTGFIRPAALVTPARGQPRGAQAPGSGARAASQRGGSQSRDFSGFRSRYQISPKAIVGEMRDDGKVVFRQGGKTLALDVHNGVVQNVPKGYRAEIFLEEKVAVLTPEGGDFSSDNTNLRKAIDWLTSQYDSTPQRPEEASETEQIAALESRVDEDRTATGDRRVLREAGSHDSQLAALGERAAADTTDAGAETRPGIVGPKVNTDPTASRAVGPVLQQLYRNPDSQLLALGEGRGRNIQPTQRFFVQRVRPGIIEFEPIVNLNPGLNVSSGVPRAISPALQRLFQPQQIPKIRPILNPNLPSFKPALSTAMATLGKFSLLSYKFPNLAQNSKLLKGFRPNFSVQVKPALVRLTQLKTVKTAAKIFEISPTLIKTKTLFNSNLVKFTDTSSNKITSRYSRVGLITNGMKPKFKKLTTISADVFSTEPFLRSQDVSLTSEINPSLRKLTRVSLQKISHFSFPFPKIKKEIDFDLQPAFKRLSDVSEIKSYSGLNSEDEFKKKLDPLRIKLASLPKQNYKIILTPLRANLRTKITPYPKLYYLQSFRSYKLEPSFLKKLEGFTPSLGHFYFTSSNKKRFNSGSVTVLEGVGLPLAKVPTLSTSKSTARYLGVIEALSQSPLAADLTLLNSLDSVNIEQEMKEILGSFLTESSIVRKQSIIHSLR